VALKIIKVLSRTNYMLVTYITQHGNIQ